MKIERSSGDFWKLSALVLAAALGFVVGGGESRADTIAVPHEFVPGQPASANDVNDNFRAIVTQLNQLVPSGTVVAFAGTDVPPGFFECKGQLVSLSANPELFNAIGYRYGGSGEMFAVPDYRGQFLRGWDHGRGVDTGRTLGTNQDDQLESHSHVYNRRQIQNQAVNRGGDLIPPASSASTEALSTESFGGNETRPVNVSVMYLIRR